ncbi:MAG: heterodisulfide reductase-related iron-sulfur binding cluster [Candidatus Heimdallarchaeota archaeon]
MPYDNCNKCNKSLPCPVTQADKNEGAYPITRDTGDPWYCTNCFYCEDVCPEYSPRQYGVDRRRLNDQSSQRMLEPLEQLKSHGTLFPISAGIKTIREELNLPPLPKSNVAALSKLYNQILVSNDGIQNNDKRTEESISEKITDCSQGTTLALFLGCLIPYRILDYERSVRNILRKMEIAICDLPFACCGSIMTESQSDDLWLVSAAYNLALAEEHGITQIIALCGGCTGNLRRVNIRLKEDSELLERVNEYLSAIGKKYSGKIIVTHLTEFLLQTDMMNRIKSLIDFKQAAKLTELTTGVQVPCQVIRPLTSSPNAALGSKLITNLLELTSIKITHYPFETLCCGSSMLPYDEEIAYTIAKKRINSLHKRNADAIVMGCGNCSMNYTVHQSEYSETILPSFFYSEILEFAFGEPNNQLTSLLEKKKEEKNES